MNKFIALLLLVLTQLSLAESIQITDSRGKLTFKQAPERVVVINWALTEQVLELGIKPVGIADIAGYRQQGGRLDDDAGIVDIGKRTAPDLKKIKALKPDIILVGYSQRPLLHQLENLGTVVYFKNFGHRWNNADKARERYLLLARLLNRSDYAQQRLQQSDLRIEQLKQELSTHLNNDLPKVTMLVPEGKSYWSFVNNSMPYYAAQKLGLQITKEYAPTKFGVKKLSFDQLPKPLGCVLLFDGNSKQQTASLEKLKKKTDCIYQLPPVNIYGGAMSIQYLAETIVQALLQKARLG